MFMEELLADVAATVTAVGGSASSHRGSVSEVVSDDCVAVIVPHEYYALTTPPDPNLRKRTIGFGVEHPGTQSFENSAEATRDLASSFEIAEASVAEMTRRGVACERFVLGYNRRWDSVAFPGDRDIDVAHLGTADESRLGLLAPVAADLASYRLQLLLPPHEWMSGERPDFMIGEKKHRLLRRSRIILNLHREGSTAFEWVRALDAIRNKCVVLTAPSTGLAPLVPGEHLLVARPETMSSIAMAALADPESLAAIADSAYQLCSEQLNMESSARRLVEIADDVATAARSSRVPVTGAEPSPRYFAVGTDKPMALWVPCERELPPSDERADERAADLLREVTRLRREQPRLKVSPCSDQTLEQAEVDVLCVSRVGDGPIMQTLNSFAGKSIDLAVHLGADGAGHVPNELDCSRIEFADSLGRAVVRNMLLPVGRAPFVMVLDAGDELLGRGMGDAIAVLRNQPDVDIAYPMAVLGSDMICNALIPELPRLRKFPYLGRGFVVRRNFLEQLEGFSEDPELEDFTDHDFWLRATQAQARAILLPRIGVRLWAQESGLALHDLDALATLAHLR